ncbi:MAG: hypothetical protein ACI33M_10670 [Lysinibacillus sp.]
MNKWLKVWSIFIFSIGAILVLLILLIVLLFFDFRKSLIQDEKEVEKVTEHRKYEKTQNNLNDFT